MPAKSTEKVIILHTHEAAPPKPAWAEPCNGCGVCCAYAPCPVGVLISRRRTGACAALEWVDDESRYRCGMLVDPQKYTGLQAGWMQTVTRRVTHRMISAGTGCDCSLEVDTQSQ
ncbi:MAG: hypothetical protein ACOVOX_17725 [Burkholderiaceae bacterium]|jgi:hypothetical protein